MYIEKKAAPSIAHGTFKVKDMKGNQEKRLRRKGW